MCRFESIPKNQQAACNHVTSNQENILNYSDYQALKTALYDNTENIFNIKQGGFQLSSGSKIVCIPVVYKIFCANRSCGSINWSFLWTSFDSSDALGSLFLHYAVGGLRVFGFEWENECNAYQTPVNITLLVPTINDYYASVDINVTLCKTLKHMTTLVSCMAVAMLSSYV
ncbi:MAG: hypothetical protein MJE68_12825 [Proteobacteria bacterium]|nr:hypothetical protein [Pseudomonadota bacterium]